MYSKLLNLLPKLALGAICIFSAGVSNPSYAGPDTRTCDEVIKACKTRANDVNNGSHNADKKYGDLAMRFFCDDFYENSYNTSACYSQWGIGIPLPLTEASCVTLTNNYNSPGCPKK
jgi:hypothetical protein